MEIMESKNKHVFWEALIIAIFIFAVGILLGYLMELNRTSKIISLYQNSELNLLDIDIQEELINLEDIGCKELFSETVDFANRVYDEAKILDRYEGSTRLSDGIVLQHKKYDLLRAKLWVEAMQLKKKCNLNFTTIVYIYEYKPEEIRIKTLQGVFSKKLGEIKQEQVDRVILIPLAGNLNLNSINILKESYNINSLPTILIDNKIKIESLEELSKLETYF